MPGGVIIRVLAVWPYIRTVASMIIVVAETDGHVNSALLSNLSTFAQVPAILEGIAASVGCRYDQLGEGRVHPVLGYILRPEEVFSAFVATPDILSVFELDRSGASLIVSFPWSRVTRVVQSTSADQVTLSLELDADRLDLVVESRNVEGGSTTNGVLRRSGYVVTAPVGSDDAAALLRFASLARRLLRSRP